MRTTLELLLRERDAILADGATGTNLFALGLTSGDSPELWNLTHPEHVAGLAASFVRAGSDLILTNSFGGNRHRLKLHDLQGRVGELNEAAARIARGIADAADRPVLVAGSIGPTGEILEPVGTLARAAAVEAFAEQAQALARGGADLLWIETMSAAEELDAAIEGASRTGLPIVATMSFDTQGRTMMGLTPEAALGHAQGLASPPVGFGANCGIGPAQLLDSLLRMHRVAPAGTVLVAKGNCGVPEYRDGAIHYGGSPEIMAAYARLARGAGARIIGGCCGTTPEHVAAMRRALDAGGPQSEPSIAEIEAALGPVAFTAAVVGDEPRRDRRPRRRAGG